MSPKSDSIDQL